MKIKGNWATLLLPIEEDKINFNLLSQQIDYYIHANVDGIYSNGTAGEFYTQSDEEFKVISLLLAEKCKIANKPFQIGASHCHPNDCVARAKFAATLSPTAIQVILPNWFPCDTETSLIFLKKIESVCQGIPIILYNPPHAKVILSAEQLRYLFDHIPSLIGFKIARLTDDIIKTSLQKEASIFVAGHFLATDARKGALGAYSNVCCLGPKATQTWTAQCLNLENEALETEKRIQTFMKKAIEPLIVTHGYSNPAVDKFMASLSRWCGISPAMRFPFKGVPDEFRVHALSMQKTFIPDFIY